MNLRIVNIVSTCTLNKNLDLKYINEKFFQTIYKPKTFSGLVKKFPNGSVLIFNNGKLVITGTKTEEIGKKLARKVARMVFASPNLTDFTIQNIVATCDFKTTFNLKILHEKFPNAILEPERYAGLVVDLNDVKVIIFHTGKVNFTKAKSMDQLDSCFLELLIIFHELNLIQ